MSEDDRKKGEEQSRSEMERLAAQLKDLILSLPPRELLGYIWSTTAVGAMFAQDEA